MATPTWKLGDVYIYVDKLDGNDPAVRGELHVLDATDSTYHYSGAMSGKINISGTLYTSGSSSPELATLRGYVTSDTTRTLVGDTGTIGDYKVQNVQWERKQALNEDYPVYRVDIELWEA